MNTMTAVAGGLQRSFPAWRKSALAAVLVLALTGLSVTPFWQSIELKGFDFLTVLTAPKKSALPIVMIGIDDISLAEVKQRWPWPRSLYAQLIDVLNAAGAAVIVFDVVFDQPTSEDEVLAQAIQRAGNVVLAAGLKKQETSHGTAWLRQDPLPLFTASGTPVGLVNLAFDRDQVMRRIPDAADVFWRAITSKLRAVMPEAPLAIEPGEDAMIRYIGPNNTYPRISFYQALDPARYKIPTGELANALVIVGRDTRSAADIGSAQVDTFATPYTTFGSQLMAGPEIHANILENVLGGQVITPAPVGVVAALLALTTLLAMLAMRRFRVVVSGLAAAAIVAGIAVLSWLMFARHDYWLPGAIAMFGVALLYVNQSVLAFMGERHQRLEVKRMFSRYVPAEVVEQLAAHPERLRLGGEHRELSVMFTDLANFTTLAEVLEPDRAADLLNRYLTEMNQIIFRHSGTIDKFIGDGIMAFWNAPLEDKLHAQHAVQSAIEMQAAMDALRKQLAAEGFPEIRMRIGVHTGVALVGNMGSAIGRLSYTAIGDSINLTARLEGANKEYGTEILLTAATAGKLDGSIVLRRVDLVKVKGKNLAVETLTPCADAEFAALSDAALSAYRNRDWAAARALWQKVLAAAPQDSLATMYLQRIAHFELAPPAADWDGSAALETK